VLEAQVGKETLTERMTSPEPEAGGPGKRTLTEKLSPVGPGAPGVARGPQTGAPGAAAAVLPGLAELERAFGESFSDLVVRLGVGAGGDRGALATSENGREVVAFDSMSPTREQVAHELTHVVQRRRFGASAQRQSLHDAPAEHEARGVASRAAAGQAVDVREAPGGEVQRDGDVAQRIHDNLHSWIDDEPAALAELQGDHDRGGTCAAYGARFGITLWADFIDNASGDTLHRALALLWPHMSVLDRLSTMVGIDDDEAGILQTIQNASDAELRAARGGIQRYLDELSVPDQYTARTRIWPEDPVANVLWLLRAGHGWLWDDEGPAATAIMRLSPAQREALWTQHQDAFGMFSDGDRAKIRRMCVHDDGTAATDADALSARMELATDGAGTDEDGVLAAVGAAGNRRDELARINASLASGTGADGAPLSPAARHALEQRRSEIGDIDGLLAPGANGQIGEDSFLGRVQGDMDSATADAALATAHADPFTRAKQALLATIEMGGLNVDEEAALLALRNLHGDVALADGETVEALGADEIRRRQQASVIALRQRLRDDPELRPVWDALDDDERGYADALTRGDGYEAAIHELTEAFEGIDTDEAAILRTIRDMAPEDRQRLRTEVPPILVQIRSYGEPASFYEALDGVLATGHIPAGPALDAAFGGWGDGTDEDMATDALAGLSEADRTRYRRGYLLDHNPPTGPSGAAIQLSPDDQAAVTAYRQLHDRMASEYTDEELDAALVTLIGLPTTAEMQTDQGRTDAATVMLARQRERLELSGALTDFLTTTDDTAAAAHVEFESRYNLAIADGAISIEEFAVLVQLDDQFNGRIQDHADTVNQVSEIAGTVAAVVAAAVVIIASGGTAAAASPGVIAWLGANSTLIATSAATSALAQVVASEAMGGSYNAMTDAEGARQALSGAINGALAVAGAALAEQAATLVGLSGRALTAQIARSAADATATSVAGKAFARGALMGLIDGSLSGSVGELAMTLTDADTWKHSVWGVLARAGEALLRGGLLGGVTGAVTGGALETAQGLLQARAIANCAVHLDPTLGPGAHIDFTVNPDGSLQGLTLVFGPSATDGDLAAHVERVVAIQRASGLLARARTMTTSLGTRAGEAAQELPKLERMIQDRLVQLRSGTLSPESTQIVESELDVFRANLDEFADVLARGDAAPGIGRIGRPDAPPGYPAPPEGHYYYQKGNGWDIRRYPDTDVPASTLEPDGSGGWRVVSREGGVTTPSPRFAEGTTAEQAFDRMVSPDSRSSLKQYWEMLDGNGLATRDEMIAAMVSPSGRTEDSVRHALKQSFEPRVLNRTMHTADGALRSEADSVLELRRLTQGLNPADQGNLTEAWYAMRRPGLTAHPEMQPGDNPSLDGTRFPDFVQGNTSFEIKSTRIGLSPRDVTQIGDVLGVCEAGGTVTLADGTRQTVSAMRLVFTDIQGARGSVTALEGWLQEHATLTIEVFGSTGARTEITKATLATLQTRYHADSLASLLEAL
jgi:hypothetical protein